MSKKTKEADTPKPWDLTPADVATITQAEEIWGTDRLLPPMDEIPEEFIKGNIYTKIADAAWCGDPMPQGEVSFKEGFNAKSMMRCVTGHLRSFAPKHEHKIAGVGYMISKMTHIIVILT